MFKKTLTAIIAATTLFGFNANSFATAYPSFFPSFSRTPQFIVTYDKTNAAAERDYRQICTASICWETHDE